MTLRKALRLAVGVVVAALFLWLILRRIEPEEVRQVLKRSDLNWVAAALVAFAVGYACRIERWRLMLSRANPDVRWRDCAGPLLASFAANNVLPFRAGDVMRSFAFNSKLGTTSGVTVATLLAERLLDLLTLLVLLGTALAVFGADATRLAGASALLFFGFAAVVMFVLLCPGLFSPLGYALGRYVSRWSPRYGVKIAEELDKSLSTLKNLAEGRRMIQLILWSTAAWLAEGCVFWGCALALPSIVSPMAAWLALPIATLATLVPSTPGYVGTFDYFAVRAMTAFANTVGSATAYAFLIHALLWLPSTVAGGFYLLLYPLRESSKKGVGELN